MVFSSFGSLLTEKEVVIRLITAILLSSVIGIEREKRNRPAGMRTHVLVCLGATLVSMVEQQTLANVAALASPQINVSVGRLTAGVVQGIGFLGAGTIIRADRKVTGLTTAASVWCTACLGVAIGAGYLAMAIVASVFMIAVLKLMQRIVIVPTYKKLLIQYVERQATNEYLNDFFTKQGVKILDVDFHTEQENDRKTYTNEYTLVIPGKTNYVQIVEALSEAENILTVETETA